MNVRMILIIPLYMPIKVAKLLYIFKPNGGEARCVEEDLVERIENGYKGASTIFSGW